MIYYDIVVELEGRKIVNASHVSAAVVLNILDSINKMIPRCEIVVVGNSNGDKYDGE